MDTTTEPQPSAEPELSAKSPMPNSLLQGFSLARRHWRFVAWAYAINLLFGLLAAVPFAHGLAPFLDHSLAAQRIAGTIDLSALLELALHLRDAHFAPIVFSVATWLNLLQVLILFLLFAAAVFVYLSGERVAVLVRAGSGYFWRFVRGSLLAGCIAGVILGVLLAARSALLARLGLVYIEKTMFAYTAATGAIIFFVALLLRLWLDLVEIYVVRLTLEGERRARRALLPAWKLLVRHFFRLFGGFLLAGLAGTCALGVCLLLWKALPANQVWLAMLVGQMGLFMLLASRFWQRGLEAALVLAADPPIVVAGEIVVIAEEVQAPSLAEVAAITSLAEPTLSELVQKLQTKPWTRPTETAPAKPTSTPSVSPGPAAAPGPVAILLGEEEIPGSALQRHGSKMPLGGTAPLSGPARETQAGEPAGKTELDPEPPPPVEKPPSP